MRRREFIALLGGAAAAYPFAASAQQPALPIVAYLSSSRANDRKVYGFADEFHNALLSATDFVDGKDVTFEYRYAEQNLDQLHTLALDLVARRVHVIFAVGNYALVAARAATQNVPIVAIDLGLIRLKWAWQRASRDRAET